MLRKRLALIFWLISVLITCLVVVAKATERRKVLSGLTAPGYSWLGGDIKAAGLHDR